MATAPANHDADLSQLAQGASTDDALAWWRFMRQCAGRWTTDPVHNGLSGNDLLAFRGDLDDPEKGIFVTVLPDGQWRAGTYEDAFPHIGDGLFTNKAEGNTGSFSESLRFLIERLGRSFFLALTQGSSPYLEG